MLSKEKAELAEELSKITLGNLNCVTYGTGGGEAVDFALKLARLATSKKKIISTTNTYHSHTCFALSAARRKVYRDPFEPLIPDFQIIENGNIEQAEKAIDSNCAAIIVEPIRGEGGVVVPPENYLGALRAFCDKNGSLLIIDEIKTGFGRTSKWFACEHFNVIPDIMCVAKSLGGSVVSISATIYSP